jgi:hypothetical protein
MQTSDQLGTAIPVARAIATTAVPFALATLVRLAQALPPGSPERRALAAACVPLRDELEERRPRLRLVR